VCNNVAAICAHLQQQQHKTPSSVALQVISPLSSSSSSPFAIAPNYLVDATGGHWRCTRYVEGSVSLEVISSTALAFSVAAAFGHFSSCMRSFTGHLADTIPGFHDTPHRLAVLQRAVDACALPERLQASQQYIAFVRERSARAGILIEAMRRLLHSSPQF
jgi:hypothetical protein